MAKKRDIHREREIEKRDGIVRDPGEPRADMPSDRPEQHGLPHPEDVNEFHGHPEEDWKKTAPEPGSTAPEVVREGEPRVQN